MLRPRRAFRLCCLVASAAIGGRRQVVEAQPTRGDVGAAAETIPTPIHVSASAPGHPHVEPHVTVHPRDASRLLAAAMVFAPPSHIPRIVAFISADSGRSWRTVALAELPFTRYPWPGQLDPWTAIGTDGTLFVSALRLGDAGGDVFIWSSRDDGRTWAPHGPLPRGGEGSFDHPVLLASGSASTPGLFLYANQGVLTDPRGAFGNSILFAAHGGTFAEPRLILPNNFNNQNGGLTQLSGGSVVATWFEIESRGTPDLGQPRLWVTILRPGDHLRMTTRLVTSRYDGGWPMIATDPSDGVRPDRLYIVWTSRSASSGGAGGRVVITRSDDAGMTWSTPVTVDDDPARGNPMLSVAPGGVVGISWLREDRDCVQLHFASLTRTSGPSRARAVSPRWCPDTNNAANRVPMPGGRTVVNRWPTGGDYHGLVAIGRSQFIAVWVDDTRGIYQVHSARVRVEERR